jgi:mRNA-degrading endonuclease RelE of RelBE toxin-antitoxin system
VSSSIQSVEIVKQYVLQDLDSPSFSDEARQKVLDDIDEVERQLTTWDRPITKAMSILSDTDGFTVYRRRQGDLRSYFIREEDTLYCVGVGKRDTTYDRDLETIVARAVELIE